MQNLLLVLCLATGSQAFAADPAPPRTQAVVGLHLGAAVPVRSPPSAFVLPMIEVGVVPAVAGGRLEPFLIGGWTRLPAKGEGQDPRVDGGAYTWTGTQQEGLVGGGLRVRFMPFAQRFNGTVAIAGAAAVGQTRVDGEAGGAAFGENVEDQVGGALLADLGGEASAGPGRVFVSLNVIWTPLHGVISGDRDLVLLAPTVGYRFTF